MSERPLTLLFVEDVAASAALYREAFGWSAKVEVPVYVEFDAGVGLMSRAAGARIVSAEAGPAAPDSLRAELYVPVSDPEAALERLAARGATLVSPVTPRDWGDRVGYARDLDGYIVAVAARGVAKVAPADLRPLETSDRGRVQAFLTKRWGSPTIAFREATIDASAQDGLLFEEGGELVGLLTYAPHPAGLEIVTLDTTDGGRGIGRALIERLAELARAGGLSDLVVVTTNDNLNALGFYQALGFRLVAVRPDAISAARARMPSIPERGARGLPILDELELRRPA